MHLVQLSAKVNCKAQFSGVYPEHLAQFEFSTITTYLIYQTNLEKKRAKCQISYCVLQLYRCYFVEKQPMKLYNFLFYTKGHFLLTLEKTKRKLSAKLNFREVT